MMASTSIDQALIERVKKSEVKVPWCEEFENMISGVSFSASKSPAMQSHRLETLKRLRSFNDDTISNDSTIESLKVRRMNVAKELIGRLGCSVNIEPPFFCGWGCNIFIGEGVYINRDVSIYDNAPVTIGNRVLIGPGVCICTGTHDVDHLVRRECGQSFAKPIWIGDDCWIGARVTVLPGVRIGRGTTVAAGAVVTKDVEEDSLVGGVPARLLRKLA